MRSPNQLRPARVAYLIRTFGDNRCARRIYNIPRIAATLPAKGKVGSERPAADEPRFGTAILYGATGLDAHPQRLCLCHLAERAANRRCAGPAEQRQSLGDAASKARHHRQRARANVPRTNKIQCFSFLRWRDCAPCQELSTSIVKPVRARDPEVLG